MAAFPLEFFAPNKSNNSNISKILPNEQVSSSRPADPSGFAPWNRVSNSLVEGKALLMSRGQRSASTDWTEATEKQQHKKMTRQDELEYTGWM